MGNISYFQAKAIHSSQTKLKEGSQVKRHIAERGSGGGLKNVHEKKPQKNSPASGMRQWKIPSVQHSTGMAKNRGGTMAIRLMF